VAERRAEEGVGKSGANQAPARAEEKVAGNKSLIITESVASAAMNPRLLGLRKVPE